MTQIPMIMLPQANFSGRRIFVELKPDDNPDMLGMRLDQILRGVWSEKLSKDKANEVFKPGQAIIVT